MEGARIHGLGLLGYSISQRKLSLGQRQADWSEIYQGNLGWEKMLSVVAIFQAPIQAELLGIHGHIPHCSEALPKCGSPQETNKSLWSCREQGSLYTLMVEGIEGYPKNELCLVSLPHSS